ncbi:CDP-diacylglycerol--glycerol-3-phosphate 3-phosphatidyltransferase [Allocatelliglobosispora scoriae]|uniref:Phosphatidylinositol phosphate synthase n=1 Tax=Allocatelliglobosispora scoriae TaxID=643052 RepID=A0A841BXZ8_9ACTN|nr:CDP-alcohol phosphatidyltransferase family protein [Allocatelliglobosispora scoriae]MBB5873034.1 CDP-diacylglycerol--glycerol-3-phosphate 3-phosphatidyltransferase [Allocatelliglobosispora scoriae]
MAKIFSVSIKAATAKLLDPIGRALLRVGVSPNAVTVAGTIGVLAGSYVAARGHLVWAVVVVTLSALTDVMDGSMARLRGTSSRFGAVLDSTMDRVADGAVFVGLAYLYRDEVPTFLAVMVCLVAGQVVSYVKARAEGLGMSCNVGLVERAERLILVGVGALMTGFGLAWGLPAALWVLAAGSIFTVFQRMWHVSRQA